MTQTKKIVLAEATVGTLTAATAVAIGLHLWRKRKLSKLEKQPVVELRDRVVLAAGATGKTSAEAVLSAILTELHRKGVYTPELEAMLEELLAGTLSEDRALGLEVLLREVGFLAGQKGI
jgi:folylpolyglutamate synthase/dihydropteroate synthase